MLEHIGRYAVLLVGGWMAGLVGILIMGTVFSIVTAGEATIVGSVIGFAVGMALVIVLGWNWAKSG